MSKDWVLKELMAEVAVGLFVVLVFVSFGIFTIVLSRDTWLGSKYSAEIIFSDVMGLQNGDNVVVRGMPVGKVKELVLASDGVHVNVVLDQKLCMRENYEIVIVSTSVLGGRHLSIDEGTGDVLEGVNRFEGKSPKDFMSDLAELIGTAKDGFADGGIIDNLKSGAKQLDEIITRVNSGQGTLGRLLSEDDKVYEDLSSAVASIKNVADKIEKGDGLLGRLVQDEELYDDVKHLVNEFRATVDDYRETTPIVTFTSIFFGAF
ncbi:MAG: MCE family protein [Lentisphaerae bacterium]|nr:MCE family protein [Lentisphaerota bacterium]